MKEIRIPLRKRIKWALAHKKVPRTAAQIHALPSINCYAGIGTLSSLLRKMVLDGDLHITKGFGKRGGNGYKLRK